MCRVCKTEGIPFREVSPSWSERELWEEAFITSIILAFQCFIYGDQMLMHSVLYNSSFRNFSIYLD
ncbi:hypothetical protein Fmac_030392 [Flemingia macrophylla]|uniref:Uncharacterized protein n=1 Tax=Flemingia macrophylla TaxID=520843 RepID=A0ABD1KZ31_9FABA